MSTQQIKQLEQINNLQHKLTNASVDYWRYFSGLYSWQFWFLLALLLSSLTLLYFFIDRRKILQIGFFGFNVHVWLTKLDELAITNGLWSFQYKLIPYLNSSFSVDAAFAPVALMLVYQWTLNKKKNYYLYTTVLCLFISFLFRPSLATFGIFHVTKGIYYFLVFLELIIVMLISKVITNLFLYFQKEQAHSTDEGPPIRVTIRRKSFLARFLSFKRKAR